MTDLIDEFIKVGNISLVEHHKRFFKTEKGEYGEGDKFIGLTVPQVRCFVKNYYKKLNLKDIDFYIKNEYHEIRLFAILCLVEKFEKSKILEEKEELVNFYLNNIKYVNNWDLVDLSCYKLLGRYCFENNKSDILYNLSKSCSLWEERISIVSTMFYIKRNNFNITLDLCKYFLNHKHHLIHKACGWMLREVGKRDERILVDFLNKYKDVMPKIMFSYAKERIKNLIVS